MPQTLFISRATDYMACTREFTAQGTIQLVTTEIFTFSIILSHTLTQTVTKYKIIEEWAN